MKAFCIIGISILPIVLNAQNIVFTASCDRTQVALGETFTLEVKVSGDVSSPPNPTLPPLPDFDVISTSRMESISIVNRRVSSEITFVYILSPRKVGKFKIGACTMQYNNQTFQTQPIEIEVVAGLKPTPTPSTRKPAPSLPRTRGGKDLFATLSVDKHTAYVNEQVILSFKFYQGVTFLSSPNYTPPSFTGFWKEDLGQSSSYKVINGRRYHVTEIRYAIFPTSSGRHEIGPAKVECQVEDFFSRPFSFSFGGETKIVEANPVKLEVLELPIENKPVNFSGAVGKFRCEAMLDNHSVHQHEPVTLSITVSGTGNIKSIKSPKIPELPDFKVYDSGSGIKLSGKKDRIAGKKTFNIILVPEREGEFQIPSLSFSYFDSQSRKYKTLSTLPLHLTVLAGKKGAPPASFSGEPIEAISQDIRYIKTQVKLESEGEYIYQNPLFFFIQIIPILALLLSLKIARQKEKLLKDEAYTRAVKADKLKGKKLLQCRRLLLKGAHKEFYGEVYRTLTEYIGGKLNIPAPALTLDMAIKGLKEKGVREEILNKLIDLFAVCDHARFGLGEADIENMRADYQSLSELISELSRKL